MAEAQVDAPTPDRLMRGFLDPELRIRVAGSIEVLDTPPVASGLLRLEGEAEGIESLITVFCCKNDKSGAFCEKTASGIQVAEVDPETGMRMAACSEHWPLGTMFLVAGEFPLVCRDRGSAVLARNHLDAYFDDCGILPNPTEGTGKYWLKYELGSTLVLVEVIE